LGSIMARSLCNGRTCNDFSLLSGVSCRLDLATVSERSGGNWSTLGGRGASHAAARSGPLVPNSVQVWLAFAIVNRVLNRFTRSGIRHLVLDH